MISVQLLQISWTALVISRGYLFQNQHNFDSAMVNYFTDGHKQLLLCSHPPAASHSLPFSHSHPSSSSIPLSVAGPGENRTPPHYYLLRVELWAHCPVMCRHLLVHLEMKEEADSHTSALLKPMSLLFAMQQDQCPCLVTQTEVILRGRRNVLQPWITSHWSPLPHCLLHAPAESPHKFRGSWFKKRNNNNNKKKTNQAEAHILFLRKPVGLKQLHTGFLSQSQRLICYFFSLCIPFQDFSNITFFGERTEIRSEQIIMLSLSGQAFFF